MPFEPLKPPTIRPPSIRPPSIDKNGNFDPGGFDEGGFDADTQADLDKFKAISRRSQASPAPAPEAPAPAKEVSSANSLEDLGTDAQLQKLSIGDASQLRRLRRTTVDYSDVGNLRRAFSRNTTKPRF